MKIKNIIKHTVATLIAIAVVYLGISFLTLDFNPSAWSEEYRVATLFMVVVSTIMMNIISYHLVEV